MPSTVKFSLSLRVANRYTCQRVQRDLGAVAA